MTAGRGILTSCSALLVSATLTFVIRFLAFLQGRIGVVEVDATFEGGVDGSEYGVAAV